ncbi:hypothetical protein HGRIS_012839 [Hohenbuehelia grisea]|uniref:Late embryogenesis abundant protein LEA-2 subgroup domain-containing protein n=1 Tax=Hohenbuehelia grisea TaxID=104357 RepID=A0ABR3ITJ2_9AGAR
MSYRDPYAGQYGAYQHNAYAESEADFNPYMNNRQQAGTQPYGQTTSAPSYGAYGTYQDEPLPDHEAYPSAARDGRPDTQQTLTGGSMPPKDEAFIAPPPPPVKQESTFDMTDFARPRERNAAALRRYRMDFQGNLWTKGGRGRCVGRFCCCTLMIAVFLIISIVLALALWIRPPSIVLSDVQPVSTGSTVQLQADGITINLGVNISVSNPNYFAVNFKQIKAEIFYPINNTDIGGGVSNDIVFNSHSQKNFTFPFAINYKMQNDPSNKVLVDLATKCGFPSGVKSDIAVDYKITLGLRILFITVSPTVSNTFRFGCPLEQGQLEQLLKNAGLSLGGLGGQAPAPE